jgi:integrase
MLQRRSRSVTPGVRIPLTQDQQWPRALAAVESNGCRAGTNCCLIRWQILSTVSKESALAQLDVALHTGMRKSEQFTATWDQVDVDRGFIYLCMTKNGTDRFVTLNSTAVAVLRRLQERHKRLGLPPAPPCFISSVTG